MTKKVSTSQPRRVGRSTADEKVRAKLEEQFQRRMDKVRQHLAEHQKYVETEEGLRQLQNLKYEPLDYLPLLEEIPWEEPPITSFAFLKVEAIKQVEDFYRQKLTLYGASFVASFALFLVLPRLLALALFLGAGLLLVHMVSTLLKDKQDALIQGLEEAQQEMERRQAEERSANDGLRIQHEFDERLRIERIEGILAGKADICSTLLKEQFQEMRLPVHADFTLELSGGVARIILSAPELKVIPKAYTKISGEGYLEYEEKTDKEIHKQYLELTTGLLAHIGIKVFELAPGITTVYVQSVFDKDKTLMHAKLTREMAEKAGNGSIEDFIKGDSFTYSTDAGFRLLSIDGPEKPEEWPEGERVHKISAKIFR